MIRLIDPVTFVVPGTAGARAPVVAEKFGAELRRAPAQFHHCLSLKQTELQELNSVSNMLAEIDIDALKIFTKSKTTETEYWQKIKNSQSKLKIYRF